MTDLSLRLGGVALANPILPAAGTLGLGHGRIFDLDRLGAIVPKTVTPEPRSGHPPQRIAETAGGLVNAIGIPSQGVEAFHQTTLPAWRALSPPLILSISADDPQQFATLAEKLSDCGAAALELNLSCPNLERGGRPFALDADATARVVAACRAATGLPLWCKLAPNAGDPVAVARAAQDEGADALVVANTMPSLVLGPDGTARLANRTGGLSGVPLKPINLRLVDAIAGGSGLPIVGCGGVATLADVLDYLHAGASAVAVGTATLSRPTTMVRLIDELAAYVTSSGRPLAALIGRQECQTA